ncbi:phenylalanine--tRNA ligase subunit beta [Barnesiella sp. WM24]|uniref:phenylalanine--tRNA ligase subunit beta n=1 Tax=Barnesiella sp. WM24 TaxID=2558278 RepID=UPI001072C798|nr:phenylalanine--tRNA ligase subunit beta [Barnesiella sp. WM24]TFU93732.1 phenylalanine--tRNA ligase subunit beta [Barnesiella sp. WM24]
MNISYNWLKEYVDFRLSPEELADALTSIGLEVGTVEEVESIRGGLRGIVIGKVLTCVEHPNSDHLHITTVDLGNGEPTQIVCGAPNVAAGQTVVVATVGTTLYDGDNEFAIKKSKIRGVESFGMICAEDEIGVGTSHDGIIVIDGEVKPGTPAAEYYNLKSDWLIEVDLTPNRVDAASHYGVARDLSAWLACHAEPSQLKRPSVDSFATDRHDGAITVEVDDYEACPRYSGVTIRNIKVAESPEWLKNYLSAIGQRPINNIVDITNFILLGMGQPLHCFDVEKINGGKIVVRKCQQDTPFTTLDGVERKLDERDLMICNAEKPMCIAGVFGGLDSGVTESTTSIFLESAYFNPTSIRKTARRHGLSTDASFRYERGTDPNATMYCLKLAAILVKELAGGEICGEPIDIYPAEIKPYEVNLRYDYLNALVGKEIPTAQVDAIVKSLEMEIVSQSDEAIDLRVPTYRVDVQRPCDVVEDVLRIYGYNNIEFSRNLRASLSFKTVTDSSNELRELISNQLTATGFNEILNNSLTAESYYEGLTDEHHAPVKLLNPLSNDLNVMRMSLLFGGLEVIEHNVNRRDADLMLYEFGKVYSRDLSVESTAENPIAPYTETERLALWLTGNIRTGNWARPEEKATFFDMKAIVANIFSRLGINGKEIELKPAKSPIYSNSVEIATRSGKTLGHLGIVAKQMLKRCDIKQEVIYADLDWNALVKLALKKKVTYATLPKTHPVKRDLALLLDEAVTMAQVEKIVRDSEKRLLRGVELFDVYQGKNLEPGKKSYAISITLQDDEKTLQDKQIEAVMGKITANLQKQLGASLR